MKTYRDRRDSGAAGRGGTWWDRRDRRDSGAAGRCGTWWDMVGQEGQRGSGTWWDMVGQVGQEGQRGGSLGEPVGEQRLACA